MATPAPFVANRPQSWGRAPGPGSVRSWALVLAAVVLCSFAGEAAAEALRAVRDPAGQVLRARDAAGEVVSNQLPPVLVSAAPEETTTPLPGGGRVLPDGTQEGAPADATTHEATAQALTAAETAPRLTIDFMTLRSGYLESYFPAGTLRLLGSASVYTLSDGSTWSSGAGTSYQYTAYLDHVEVDGETIRYVLRQPEDLLYRQTDYNAGEHSSQGTLGVSGELVLEATRGATTAVLRGGAEIVSNTLSNYSEPRFNFFSAIVGAVVPYELTYTLNDGTWQEDTFDTSFSYRRSDGWVDFANPISVPQVVGLEIRGSGQAPAESDLQYYAIAHYDNGSTRNVTHLATWSVSPDTLADIALGLLSTGSFDGDATLVVGVVYEEDGHEVGASKEVRLVKRGNLAEDAWPTYQGNPAHTGYVPTTLEPEAFSIRWERQVGPGRPLQPVAAAEGRVFTSVSGYFAEAGPSLFALDARDGETLWTKEAGRVFSVNPPAYAYGNVYLQTGKGTSAPRPLLRAFDAATGNLVFETEFAAQWESYLAPTVFDGSVYINGGYYGGMYALDAFSGEQRWFESLPQYDDWTPAVDEQYAYAYVGEYSPGLYVVDRTTGERIFMIPDDQFDWNGWSMNLAPVLGGRDDVLVIHDGRLISFDVAARRIGWQLEASFRGQPTVREGVIYAIDGGRVVALDQETGTALWSWQPPGSATPQGTLLVTDTHLFVGTESETHAIELLSRTSVWSHPASGHLALGNETLYIARPDGWLTAIAMPVYSPAAVAELEIEGPSAVSEGTTTPYRAWVHYEDGRVRDRTELVQWSVDAADVASVGGPGELVTAELFAPTATVTLMGVYEEDGVAVDDAVVVEVSIAVPVSEFVTRHLEGARALTLDALDKLDEARRREEAAKAVLEQIASGAREGADASRAAIPLLGRVLAWGRNAHGALEDVSDALLSALGVVEQASAE